MRTTSGAAETSTEVVDVVFESTPTVPQRVGLLGLAAFWAAITGMYLFPPSGNAWLPWLIAPMTFLASTHFLRSAIDRTPRLLIDETGITDRTSVFGGTLHVPWEALRRVSVSKVNGSVELEVSDVGALASGASVRRRLQIWLRRVFGQRKVEIRRTFLGIGVEELCEKIETQHHRFERSQLGLGPLQSLSAGSVDPEDAE